MAARGFRLTRLIVLQGPVCTVNPQLPVVGQDSGRLLELSPLCRLPLLRAGSADRRVLSCPARGVGLRSWGASLQALCRLSYPNAAFGGDWG